eukprot:1143942-Pelagomonas_calceolata.AAC.8
MSTTKIQEIGNGKGWVDHRQTQRTDVKTEEEGREGYVVRVTALLQEVNLPGICYQRGREGGREGNEDHCSFGAPVRSFVVDVKRHGVDLFGRDALVLGRVVSTLGTFAECATGSDSAVPLVSAIMELLMAPQQVTPSKLQIDCLRVQLSMCCFECGCVPFVLGCKLIKNGCIYL